MLKSRFTLLALAMFPVFVHSQVFFSEVGMQAGIGHLYLSQQKMGGGVAFFDFDADGDEDMYLTGGLDRDALYENNGDGTFTDITLVAGLGSTQHIHTMGVVTGDIDNDGFREIFLTTQSGEPNRLFYNQGDGTFLDISQAAGLTGDSLWSTSATMGDIDLDGDLDIYAVNYVEDVELIFDSLGNPISFSPTGQINHLYRNEGNLTFTDIALSAQVADSGCALAVTFTDFNEDGYPDILIANDHGMWYKPNKLFRNNGPGLPFSDESAGCNLDAQMYGMGIAISDYDHDQDLDYYMTNIGANELFRHGPQNVFDHVAGTAGVIDDSVNGALTTGWGTMFMDVDNDSWDDLFVSNGHITTVPFITNATSDPDRLFRNLGNGNFEDISSMAGIGDTAMGRGAAYADYDLDGDLDILSMVIHWDSTSGQRSLLYRNDQATGNHWVGIRLQGTISNRDAYGAQMLITAGGQTWRSEINGGCSHMSQNSSIAHFGLGNATTVDELIVRWPNGGIQLFQQLPGDTLLTLVEDSSAFVANDASLPLREHLVAYPVPASAQVQVRLPASASGAAGTLLLLNAEGRICLTRNLEAVHGPEASLDVRQLAAGLYTLVLQSERGTWRQKLSIVH